jgi:hypothetical protein
MTSGSRAATRCTACTASLVRPWSMAASAAASASLISMAAATERALSW